MVRQSPPGRPPMKSSMRAHSVRRPTARGGSSPLLIAGYAALGFVCLILAGVSFLYIAAPVDLVRDRLVEEVRLRTGRELVIAGPVSMSFFPRAGVTLDKVALSDTPGLGGHLLTVERISAQIGLSDLLSRKVQIRRLLLSSPVLNLRVDRNGRRNWDFASSLLPEGPVRTRYAQVRGTTLRDAPANALRGLDVARVREALAQVLPGELIVERGTLNYRNAATSEALDLSGMDLELAASSLSAPVQAKGTFTLRGQPMAYTATLASLSDALDAGRGGLIVKVQGVPLTGEFDGTVSLHNGAPDVDGSLNLKSASIPALGLWLGRPIAMSGPTDLSFSGRIKMAAGTVALDNFDSVLAGSQAQGSLTVDLTTSRPKLKGELRVASLDLGSILLQHPAEAPPSGSGNPQKSDPIGDILRQQTKPGQPTQVRGFTQRQGAGRDWSDERLDPRILGLIDADLRISAAQIVHHDIKTQASRIGLLLADRNLRIDLEDVVLYGGRGRGVATVDAGAAVPAMSLNLSLDGIMARPFLKDAADFEWLDGRTSISIAIAGQGFSERELVETLSGTADVKTVNGHLSGLSLPKIIRSLETGQIPSLQIQPAEQTPFSEFGGTFVIQKGVAQNNDLRLYTQQARVTGAGTVQLPTRQLAYDMRAKVSGSGGGQPGTVVSFANIELPLRIEGPWDKPVVGLKGQEQLLEGIKNLGKNLKNPEVQETLRGLLGGGADGRVKPGDLLNRLLKKE